jgi:hypothetical protein
MRIAAAEAAGSHVRGILQCRSRSHRRYRADYLTGRVLTLPYRPTQPQVAAHLQRCLQLIDLPPDLKQTMPITQNLCHTRVGCVRPQLMPRRRIEPHSKATATFAPWILPIAAADKRAG